jgi:hypothetical protein
VVKGFDLRNLRRPGFAFPDHALSAISRDSGDLALPPCSFASFVG